MARRIGSRPRRDRHDAATPPSAALAGGAGLCAPHPHDALAVMLPLCVEPVDAWGSVRNEVWCGVVSRQAEREHVVSTRPRQLRAVALPAITRRVRTRGKGGRAGKSNERDVHSVPNVHSTLRFSSSFFFTRAQAGRKTDRSASALIPCPPHTHGVCRALWRQRRIVLDTHPLFQDRLRRLPFPLLPSFTVSPSVIW